MSDYKWRENIACVATYRVLEGDLFLDQFEDVDHSFTDAGKLKMSELRYWLQTTSNPNFIKVLSFEIARKFLTHVSKVYTVTREAGSGSSGVIITTVADIFADKDKTLRDLAEAIDGKLKFPDEA